MPHSQKEVHHGLRSFPQGSLSNTSGEWPICVLRLEGLIHHPPALPWLLPVCQPLLTSSLAGHEWARLSFRWRCVCQNTRGVLPPLWPCQGILEYSAETVNLLTATSYCGLEQTGWDAYGKKLIFIIIWKWLRNDIRFLNDRVCKHVTWVNMGSSLLCTAVHV